MFPNIVKSRSVHGGGEVGENRLAVGKYGVCRNSQKDGICRSKSK